MMVHACRAVTENGRAGHQKSLVARGLTDRSEIEKKRCGANPPVGPVVGDPESWASPNFRREVETLERKRR
jgi:hypothetical protein